MGASIKYVRTEGEGGLRIARFCGQIVLIGCVKCGRRGRGVENPENFADVLYVWSLVVQLFSCLGSEEICLKAVFCLLYGFHVGKE